MAKAHDIGDEDVVAHELDAFAEPLCELAPAVPVVLGQSVLDGDHRVAIDPRLPAIDQLAGIEGSPLALQFVLSGPVELGGSRIERDEDVLTRAVAASLDGVDQQRHRFLVGIELRRESALVALAGAESGLVQALFERVKHLRAPAKPLPIARRAGRHHHEFLEVDFGLRVLAAVQDVHHRHRHHQLAIARQIAIERLPCRQRRRPCHRQRGTENRIGAQP